jgi:hypothetical protein
MKTDVGYDLKQLLGAEVIDWLIRATKQGASQPWPDWRWGPKPGDGCWRDAGWRTAAQIVADEFDTDQWVTTSSASPMPGVSVESIDYRWRVAPDVFLCVLEAKLTAERNRWIERDGINFHGASGALDCCLTAVRRLRQTYTCDHEWGRVRSRPYSHDEPPEPDYRRCESCGAERDVEDDAS